MVVMMVDADGRTCVMRRCYSASMCSSLEAVSCASFIRALRTGCCGIGWTLCLKRLCKTSLWLRDRCVFCPARPLFLLLGSLSILLRARVCVCIERSAQESRENYFVALRRRARVDKAEIIKMPWTDEAVE